MDSERGAAHYSQINAGSRLYGLASQRARVVVAGAAPGETADNVWNEGKAIDRTTPALFLSAQNVITIHPTLNAGESVTIERRYRHSEDGSTGWEELPSLPDAEIALVTVLAAAVAAGTPFSYRDDLDLAGAKQYVRCDVRINLSRANTDECRLASVMTLAGVDVAPTT